MSQKTKQRGLSLLVMFTLMFSLVSSVFADAANPDTVDVQVNNQTVTLSGTWSWFTHPGSCTDRWVGWAVDWDDPNDPGTQVNGKDKNKDGTPGPGTLWYVGTQKDNTVHTNENCGSVVNGLRQGTWGDISHTYTEPGTYHACVLMYDIHLKDGAPKEASEMVAGGGPNGLDHNKDNSAETNGTTPSGGDGADCIPAEIIIPSTPTLTTQVKSGGNNPPAGGVALGTTVTDRATLGETGNNGPVTGEVDFFVCGPTAAPANCNGDTSAGQNKDISNGVANSSGVQLNSSGWYCFRAEYDSNTAHYNDTSHTNATTECVYAKPTITVVKDAAPTTISEPGGTITFSVSVTNNGGPNGVADVTINSLSDDIYGNLDNKGTCDVPQTIAAGATYSCTFTGPVSGNAGSVHTDTVTATGKDSNDNTVTDDDNATVTLTNVAPIIATLKAANPTSLPEPGGNVTFTVTVTNTSTVDPETITSLNDSVYGVLAGDADCKVGTVLPIGGSCSFDFVGPVTGNAGFVHVNIATVCAVDDDGSQPACANDDATVTITDVASSISVDKTAAPTSIAEPGGSVTFTVVVTNTSAVDSLTISKLHDDVYGDLAGDADCQIGTVLAHGASCTFSFTETVSGNAGSSHKDTVEACGTDNDNTVPCDTDDATVTITNVSPVIATLKAANPTSLPEPGGNVTFTVTVTNTSQVDPETITSLNDSVFGPLTGDADCQVGTVLPIGGSCSFDFVRPVTGNAGFVHTNIATVCAVDDDQSPETCDSDDATVTITDVASSISVDKTAAPTSIAEPGGSVTFTVVVTNTSAVDSLTISKLHDDVYGDLAGDADCQIGTVLAHGASCTFSFTETVSGNAGSSHKDTVEACGTDNDNTVPCDTDDATVTITDVASSILVAKSANPTSLPEPGGNVTFSVIVTNTSAVDSLTISSLDDDIYGALAGDADCKVGTVLAPAAWCTFDFVGAVSGNAGSSHTDIVEACATDNDQTEPCDTDDATVTLTDVEPVIATIKAANPTSLPEPGGMVTFTVTVTNSSPVDAVMITSLNDSVFGVLAGDADCHVGTVLEKGASCSFNFQGQVTGNAGFVHTNIATVCAVDDDGTPDCDDDDATVTITDVASSISVTKTANPTHIDEPGGNVTFTVVVHNTSAVDSLTISSLEDSVYGTLAGDADCKVGTVLAAGASCTFDFVGAVSGNAGDTHTNTVEACAEDNDNTEPCDEDDEIVEIDDVPPTIEVTKDVDKPVANVNDLVTFTVTVQNDSDEAVTLESLVDSIYGDLTTLDGSTCETGGTIPAGDDYVCTFTAVLTESETDTVTACVADDDESEDCDDDDAHVDVFPPDVSIIKVADDTSVNVGDTIGFKVTISNDGEGDAKDVVVTDTLPTNDGLDWTLDSQSDPGVCVLNQAGTVVTCTIALFEADDSIWFHVESLATAETAEDSPVVNTACVSGSNFEDPCADDEVDVFSLTIDKTNNAPIETLEFTDGSTADVPTADEGTIVTYTLTYDVGTSDISDAIITDELPDGVTYVTVPGATGNDEFTFVNYDPNVGPNGTLTWTAAAVTKDGSVTYQVTVDTGASKITQPLTNLAAIESTETPEDTAESDIYVPVIPLAETDKPTGPPSDVLVTTDGTTDTGASMMVILAILGLLVVGIGFVTPVPAAVRRRNHQR